MRGLTSFIPATMAVGAGLLQLASATLPAVSVKGNAFFANNERFYIRGLDYQPGMALAESTSRGCFLVLILVQFRRVL